MQRGRSTLDSFPEPMDLNQGSISNNTALNQSVPIDNLLNPVESRLSNHMLSSGERSISCTSTSSHIARSFSGWDQGESSSSANLQDRIYDDNMKLGHVWATSVNGCANPDIRLQASQPEPSSVLRREYENSYGGNHMSRRVLNIPDSGSNVSPLSTDLSGGYIGNNDRGQGTGTGSSNLYWPVRSETPETSAHGTASDNFGVSSGSSGYLVENGDGSGSSLGAWGSSCKRKALEGSPTHAYSGGSSSSNPQAEMIARYTVPARYNSSGISISSSPANGNTSQPEQMNSRNNGGMGTASEIFPPLSMTGFAETSAGNVNGRLNFGHQEPDFFGLPFTESALGPSSSSSSHQPARPFPATGSSMLMNSSNPLNQSHMTTHVPGFARSMHQFPWNGSLDSQGSSSSDSFMFTCDRNAAFRDEFNSRSSLRNNLENPAFASASETRTLVQDPTTWNLTIGNTRSSRSGPSSSRSGGPSSSMRTLPTVWPPHQNPTTHNQQGITEYAPWTLFPPLEPEYGVQRGHLPLMPPTSSSEDAVMLSSSSRRRHQHYSRSALLMDAPGEAVNGWRALAVDIEGRNRLIRQVLSAVRRGDNLRAQDFTVFDPFISGVAELQDRHSNMRLDVDNMSYEELLALEERIGNVSTGLSEEFIMRTMKQQNYLSVGSSSNSEPCCICQEEYVAGDQVGTLDCAHEFHTNCIKQWLLLKNLCPICKMTALET